MYFYSNPACDLIIENVNPHGECWGATEYKQTMHEAGDIGVYMSRPTGNGKMTNVDSNSIDCWGRNMRYICMQSTYLEKRCTTKNQCAGSSPLESDNSSLQSEPVFL